jgi:predicted MPP superfamily phosphohydrolase
VAAAAWLVAGAALGALPAQAGALDAQAATYFGPVFAPLAGVAVTVAMAVAAWGYTHGHRRLRTTRIDVPLPGLSGALDGLRIVHISDLHLGPTAERGALRDAIDRVNALEPDVVCVSGDIVDSPITDLEHWMPELARLRARHGVYAVLGNHDRYAGANRVAGAIRAHTDWRLLRDEVVRVETGRGTFRLIGLEDRSAPWCAKMLPRLHAQVPAGEPCVLLVHQPGAFPTAASLGVPLTLAGHTHGGQIAVPGLAAVNPARILMTSYDGGTFTSGGSVLHVNRGLGTSGQRVRIAVPREITVVTLAGGDAAVAA